MDWLTRLDAELSADRALLAHVYAGEVVESPLAPFAAHQRDHFGLPLEKARLPEHFRGDWERAKVCFLGPHIALLPQEEAPRVTTDLAGYVAHYRERPEKRDPYGHYQAIMEGEPWLATELVHWPGEKEFALKLLKTPLGTGALDAALDVTWALLRESPVEVLVLTGNDALKWVLPRLGGPAKLPGVTQLHGQNLGSFPLPGAPGREIAVVASFHWSAEMPMFVRKVAGLGGLKVGDAIRHARAIITNAIDSY